MMFGLHLFHSHTKVNPKTLFLFCQMKTFNNHDASHCSVLKYKLTKDGARAATAMTSFVRLLPLCKKIIPGIECAICVEYCLGAPYRPLPGFLRWVARYFWSDDDTLFQFDVQKVVSSGFHCYRWFLRYFRIILLVLCNMTKEQWSFVLVSGVCGLDNHYTWYMCSGNASFSTLDVFGI